MRRSNSSRQVMKRLGQQFGLPGHGYSGKLDKSGIEKLALEVDPYLTRRLIYSFLARRHA